MKIAICDDYGGFGLSEEALKLLKQRTNNPQLYELEVEWNWNWRCNPVLIDIIEELGLEKAAGAYCTLKVVEIPDEYDFTISEYDGLETVGLKIREDHLRWLIQTGSEDEIVNYVMMWKEA